MNHNNQPATNPHNYDTLVKPFDLTAGGLPKLYQDEIEITSKAEAALYACSGDEAQERLQGGRATLTTHRILWSGRSQAVPGGGVNVCIHLSDVREARPQPRRRLMNSSKIHIFPTGQIGSDIPAVMLSVKGRDEFYSHMQSALSRQAWVKETAAEVMGRRAGGGDGREGGGGSRASTAGIAGILRRQEANRKATAEIATEAFSDLKSLIDKAKEVVVVVERYSAALHDKQAAATAGRGGFTGEGGRSGGGGDPTQEAEDLSIILQDIGIASPVTKTSAGTRYHQQLARQLADFLSSPPGNRGARSLLDMFGGMMTLPDVFSVFNRARGTELVSPADLLATAHLLGPTRLGMSLRRFASGVLVIQADSHSDRAVGERLVRAAGGEGWGQGLVATQVARDMRVSVTLAMEHLRTAEASGLLCRDESVEGTRFYVNPFDRFVKALEDSELSTAAVKT